MVEQGFLLAVRGIYKSYAAPVLRNVSLDIAPGEVHALIGENGAGKSTLCRIIAGIIKPDQGQMFLNGKDYRPVGRRDAERYGVRMVTQELTLIPTLSVSENIFFSQMPNRLGWIKRRFIEHRTSKLLSELGLERVDPGTPAGRLGVGHQQLVEIAAALVGKSRVLILDEPTAALTAPEIERLFELLGRLKQDGVGILYVSHRLEEVLRIADQVTVLRDGEIVATRPARQTRIDELVRLMVGRRLEKIHRRAESEPGSILLRVEDLCLGRRVRNVSFEVREGEIVGFAGLMGAGRTETMRALFMAERPTSGRIYLGDLKRPVRWHSPADAVRAGLGMIPEDRKTLGLFLPLSVRMNLTVATLSRMANRFGMIDRRRELVTTRYWIDRLSIRCRDPEQPVAELSGGNQQKLLVARWLLRDCKVMIFDEPTRGVDVGARYDIYRFIIELANAGKGIVVVSSDLKELMTLADRILVMSAGRITGEFHRDRWSEEEIMAAALASYLQRPAGG